MLPVVHVRSLLTVAKQMSEVSREHEKTRDAYRERDLAGLHVYQSYLVRLRRMHRNYVRKAISQQGNLHARAKIQQAAPNNRCSDQRNDVGDRPTRTNYRVPVSVPQGISHAVGKLTTGRQMHVETSSNGATKVTDSLILPKLAEISPPPKITPGGTDKNTYKDDDEVETRSKPVTIKIPCGRENSSFEHFEAVKKKKEVEKSGVLSFRMWRRSYNQSGSVYSL